LNGNTAGFNSSRLASPVRLIVLLSLFSVFLLSCATVPPSAPPAGWLGVLPPLTPDSLYASVDVASSAALLEVFAGPLGSNTAELERVVTKLDRVHARIRPSPRNVSAQIPELDLIVVGSMPAGPLVRRLNSDPTWQRVMLDRFPAGDAADSGQSHRTYWQKDSLQIAAPQRGLLLLAGGGTGPDTQRGVEALLWRLQAPQPQRLPPHLTGEAERADIFLYLPSPAVLAASVTTVPAQDSGALLQSLPLRQGWVSATRDTSAGGVEGYRLEVVFLLEEVDSPRSVEMLLRLMLTLWLRKLQVDDPVETLKAAGIRADTQSARIESLFLANDEIAALIATTLPPNLISGRQ
jgi:hypothetical protein